VTTIIVLILLGLAAVAGYLFWQQRQSGTKSERAPAMTIENVRPGGGIHLARVGADMEDMDVEIVGRHLYDEDGYQWFELEGEAPSGKVWVDVEEDDELEVSISLRKLSLKDVGLTREDLDAMVDRDDGTISFEGRDYSYEEAGEATFHRNENRDRKERFRYWDFESDDGKWSISIEAWGKEHQVHLSQALSPSQVEVFSLGGSSDESV